MRCALCAGGETPTKVAPDIPCSPPPLCCRSEQPYIRLLRLLSSQSISMVLAGGGGVYVHTRGSGGGLWGGLMGNGRERL